MRLTLIDVAREAGVSTATVDRVLNNRSGVRRRTRDIVVETARRLGYIAEEPSSPSDAQSIGPSGTIRLEFVLPEGPNMFVRELQRQLETQAASRFELAVRISAIEGFNPDTLARALVELEGKAHGIGIVALDHPTVREAIRRLSEAGVKIVTLASDILHVPRVAYIGIDNRAAGRLAGYVLGRFLMTSSERRKVALFAGSLSYRGHEEREMGFRHMIKEEFPNLQIVELREMRDDEETAFSEATQLLHRHPDLAGVYNIGAGNEGIVRALKANPASRTVYVAHELTAHNRARLLDGAIDAVIDQNPRVEAREAINILSQSIKGLPYDYHPPRLQIIFRENIPET
jgi:LacI family transcriptional regulator